MARRCSVCKAQDARFNAGLKYYCSPECGAKLALILREKAKKESDKIARRELKQRKDKLDETVPIWTKKAQQAFNAYIRARDHDRPCISCGKYEHELMHSTRGGLWDCGHYRSVGSCPELRFETLNAHKQCKKCNSFLSGNIVEYRFGIAARLSISELQWLEGPHKAKRYRVEELKEITQIFKAKLKELKHE